MGKKKNQVQTQKEEPFWGHAIEYVMPREMFNSLTEDCKGDRSQAALSTINDTFGLLGHVTTITLEGV